MVRVMLVDAQLLVRGAVAHLLRQAGDLEVVGEASSLEEAIPLVERTSPDVLLVDLYLPGSNGAEAVARCRELWPELPVLALSSTCHPDELRGSVQLGVRGYVSKRSATPEELARAVRLVASGSSYFCPDASAALASTFQTSERTFSPRLLEVLEMAARGMTTQEIADQLGVSPRTVEKYRSSLLLKLEARNLVEALERARELRLLVV